MTDTDLKQLLSRLSEVLENTEKVDAETLKLVQELDEEINRYLAVDHPVAERFLREIMDALAKVGI